MKYYYIRILDIREIVRADEKIDNFRSKYFFKSEFHKISLLKHIFSTEDQM